MKKASARIGIAVAALVALALGLFAYQIGKVSERGSATSKNNDGNLVQFYSPSLGLSDAKVTIVEFLDPSCEACRAFYPIVKSILTEHQGRVRLVVRYAAFHKGSDVVIKILEAAKLQGLYWQTLEAIFSSQPVWADHSNPQVLRVWEFVQPVGLDIERAKRDMESAGIASILKQDTADLLSLKVERTPTFYVNGKLLVAVSPDGLRAMVQKEITANYKQE